MAKKDIEETSKVEDVEEKSEESEESEDFGEENKESESSESEDTGAASAEPQREMHKIKCADCGKDAEVPFQPTEGRPVYCRDCFMKHRKPRSSFGGYNRRY